MKNTNTLTRNLNRLSPELYFANADYFDEGVLLSLENQVKQNQILLDRLSLYQVSALKNKKIIKNLTLKTKDMKVQLYNLKLKDQDKGNTIEGLHEEIEEIYEILNDQIGSRDTTIEEQEKIIQNQNEIINELRRQLKKYRFADTTNTNNPTSAYPFDNEIKTQESEAKKPRKPHPVNLREVTGRKKGGQRGHAVHQNKMNRKPCTILDKW